MNIIHIGFYKVFRLPLEDGRRVFMAWSEYGGPDFYLDKAQNREIDGWWYDEPLCKALDWFINRGYKA